MRSSPWIPMSLAALAGAGCNVLPIPSVHSRGSTPVGGGGRFATPIAVVILPPSVDAFEESEDRGRRSEAQSRAAAACIVEVLRVRLQDPRFELRELPALDDAQLAGIREHVGLCGVVAPLYVTGAPISGTEHTLGPGLAFLGEATGAEAALIANGREIGKDIDGESGASAALGLSLVELRSGRLLWVAQVGWYDRFHAPSLRSAEDVVKLVDRVLANYPPLEAKPAHPSAAERGGTE